MENGGGLGPAERCRRGARGVVLGHLDPGRDADPMLAFADVSSEVLRLLETHVIWSIIGQMREEKPIDSTVTFLAHEIRRLDREKAFLLFATTVLLISSRPCQVDLFLRIALVRRRSL